MSAVDTPDGACAELAARAGWVIPPDPGDPLVVDLAYLTAWANGRAMVALYGLDGPPRLWEADRLEQLRTLAGGTTPGPTPADLEHHLAGYTCQRCRCTEAVGCIGGCSWAEGHSPTDRVEQPAGAERDAVEVLCTSCAGAAPGDGLDQ